MGDKTTQEIIKCLDTAAKLLRGEAVSPNDNVGSSSHGSRTSENTTHSAELAIPITTVHVPSPSPSFQYSRVTSNLRNLFKPYGTSKGRGRGVNLPQPSASLSTWTHKFICLSSKDSEIIPSKDEKRTLFEAGLGERKLTLVKTSDSPDFLQQLEEKFPKLKGCGGIELLRTSSTSRSTLQLINPGQHGYTVEYLSNCYLGQATCFIRPIQKDLDATPIDEGEKTMQTEKCMTCGRDILLTQLRSHVRECGNADSDNELPIQHISNPEETAEQCLAHVVDPVSPTYLSEDQPKKSRKISQVSQLPVCKFACHQQDNNHDEVQIYKGYSYCPICLQMFPDAYIETHASVCGESTDKKAAKSDVADVDLITRSFQDEVMRIRKDAVDVWEIPVIRRLFIKTAMAEMESANEDEWLRQLKIDFIGEEGVDAGGPCREFFSLLFRNTPVFENGGFSLNSELLEKKHYMYVGRMSSLAIINGHPGPKCINNYLVNYILEGIQPECTLTQLEMISRDDVSEAIKEIDTVNADNKYDITEKYAELLDCSGFRKALNQDTKEEAVRAMQNHFIFFKWLPSLLQFIEGFKLLGVLELCRKHPTDSRKCLEPSDISYSEVMDFFKPSYSSEKEKKEKEEVIVYNFGQFLKKVERQRITSNWINLDIDEEKKDTNVSMKNVLQAFVGSEGLPTDIDFGIIEFDHQSENLSSVNTCAPSITIRQISQNQNYQTLENHLLNIIVGTDGFDMK